MEPFPIPGSLRRTRAIEELCRRKVIDTPVIGRGFPCSNGKSCANMQKVVDQEI